MAEVKEKNKLQKCYRKTTWVPHHKDIELKVFQCHSIPYLLLVAVVCFNPIAHCISPSSRSELLRLSSVFLWSGDKLSGQRNSPKCPTGMQNLQTAQSELAGITRGAAEHARAVDWRSNATASEVLVACSQVALCP